MFYGTDVRILEHMCEGRWSERMFARAAAQMFYSAFVLIAATSKPPRAPTRGGRWLCAGPLASGAYRQAELPLGKVLIRPWPGIRAVHVAQRLRGTALFAPHGYAVVIGLFVP